MYLVRFEWTKCEKLFATPSILKGEVRDPEYELNEEEKAARTAKLRDLNNERRREEFEAFIGYEGYNLKQNEHYVVIDYEREFEGTNRKFMVKFDSGYIGKFSKRDILDGGIVDPYYPSIYGVACKGLNAPTSNPDGSPNREYNIYHKMISRCYNVNCSNYSAYGALGVRVCDRWLCYETFYYDLPTLANYRLWKG